jgi:hypothetical protein
MRPSSSASPDLQAKSREYRSRSAAEVVVRLIDPVLPRWTEHVDIQGVFERFGAMRDVGRNGEDLAGVDRDFLLAVRAEPEA